jgi:hypothetical protein
MSKKIDPRDNYGPPITKKEDTTLSSSSSYISKAITPVTPSALSAGIRPSTLTPLAFTSTLKNPKPQNNKINYYTPPVTTPKPTFITKKSYVPIIPLESQYLSQDASLLQVVSKALPSGFFFLPTDLNRFKNRRYYEFILIDTESISLTHNYDKNDPEKIIFSKFKINKVLSPSDWNQPPSEVKNFSRTFIPQNYSYYDYMVAWYHFLDIEPFNHTWFIWFNKDISLRFPNWFIKWFETIGPFLEVFPDYAKRSFEEFTQITTCPAYKSLLCFCAAFGITWITSWTFGTELLWADASAQELVKRYSIKWWSKFNPDLISSKRLAEWCRHHPDLCKPSITAPADANFLSDRSRLLASLAAISNPQQFMNKLQEAMTAFSDTDSITSTSDNINEDDCYGITDL